MPRPAVSTYRSAAGGEHIRAIGKGGGLLLGRGAATAAAGRWSLGALPLSRSETWDAAV